MGDWYEDIEMFCFYCQSKEHESEECPFEEMPEGDDWTDEELEDFYERSEGISRIHSDEG